MIEHTFPDDLPPADLLDGSIAPFIPKLELKLVEQGFSKGQIQRLLTTARGLGRYLDRHGIKLNDAGSEHLQAYSQACGRTRHGRRKDCNTGLSTIQEILGAYGILSKQQPRTEVDRWLDEFDAHQKNVRGLKPQTCGGYRPYLRRFLLDLCRDSRPDWSRLSGPYITQFIKAELERVSHGGRSMIGGLRSFLRFLIAKGLISRGYLRAIPRMHCPRYSSLPQPLTLDQHRMVLDACNNPAAGSRRDRAIIALLASLGLRGCEVRCLQLDDIDWKEGILHIRKGKSPNERVLPLPKDAGELMAEYIRFDRPPCTYREVFLTTLAPRVPFSSPRSLNYTAREFLKKLGLQGPRLGTHCFRHTAASLMVKNGATIKQVADVLGHQSIATTKIYIKLDQPSLAEVALPWPGGDL